MSRVACGINTVKHARLALDAANPNSFYVAGVVGRPDGLMADPAPCQAEVLVRDFIREPIPGGHEVVQHVREQQGYPPAKNVELLQFAKRYLRALECSLSTTGLTQRAHDKRCGVLVFLGQGDAL